MIGKSESSKEIIRMKAHERIEIFDNVDVFLKHLYSLLIIQQHGLH